MATNVSDTVTAIGCLARSMLDLDIDEIVEQFPSTMSAMNEIIDRDKSHRSIQISSVKGESREIPGEDEPDKMASKSRRHHSYQDRTKYLVTTSSSKRASLAATPPRGLV